ncbi:MAG: T9SS type A sorting domain-containing protein [Candidatus Zixiibacteriota bacterium]
MRTIGITLLVALIVAESISSTLAADISVTYRSSTLWSGITGIVVHDTTLVCSTVNGLLLLNVTDPVHPRYVSELYLSPGTTRKVRVRGDKAYIAAESLLYVVDISNVACPRVAGTRLLRDRSRALDVVDTLAYVGYSGTHSGLQILDVSKPASIVEVGALHVADSNMYAYSVKVLGSFAYCSMDASIWVIDISDPTSPVKISSLQQFDPGGLPYIPVDFEQGPQDTLLLVANLSGFWPAAISAFSVINIADPYNPALSGSIELDGYVWQLALADSIAMMSNGRRGVPLINIADPAHPDTVSRYGMMQGYYEFYFSGAVAVKDTLMYVSDFGPQGDAEYAALRSRSQPAAATGEQYISPSVDLHVVNIADPANPTRIGGYTFPPSVTAVVPGGRFAYALYYGNEGSDDTSADLTVVDLINPDIPAVRGTYYTTGTATAGYLADTLLYLAVGWLEVVNVADPDQPCLLSSLPTGGECLKVVVQGNLAYATCGQAGLYVIDISDPVNPKVTGTLRTRNDAGGIALNGNYAYIGDVYAGIAVVDITDPSRPVLLPYFDDDWWAGETIVQNGYLYVATWGGVVIYDIHTDPAQPAEIGGIHSYATLDYTVRFPFLYVANGYDGVTIFDVSDPYTPRISTSVPTPHWTTGVTVDDQHVYISNEYGLLIYDWSDITDAPAGDPAELPWLFTLNQNYPNPFNPATTISYDLNRRAAVKLTIYNTLGQRVTTLVNGPQSSGHHEVRWEAREHASGVYFYQLSIDGRTESRKMILLK